MVIVNFNPENYELTIEGHSEYAEKGKDIVCASVSTLFYTLGQALHESQKMLTHKPMFKDEDGKGKIKCKPKKEYAGNIARTYWTILTGIELVASNYPDHVKLVVGGLENKKD